MRALANYTLLTSSNDGAYALNHWSFSQLCGLCGVSRDTINVLSPETASRALEETKPSGTKPLQILTSETDSRVRRQIEQAISTLEAPRPSAEAARGPDADDAEEAGG